MRTLSLFLILALGLTTAISGQNASDFTNEIRYWQDVANPGSNEVFIDTMLYHGRDRAGFDYSNADCISYFCKDEDNMIYSLMDEIENESTEWTVNELFVRKVQTDSIQFRSKVRKVHMIYVSDPALKNTGIGTYALFSKEFGVIYRWNTDGEIFQLLRIDIVKNDQVQEQLDLTPLMDQLYLTPLFAKN